MLVLSFRKWITNIFWWFSAQDLLKEHQVLIVSLSLGLARVDLIGCSLAGWSRSCSSSHVWNVTGSLPVQTKVTVKNLLKKNVVLSLNLCQSFFLWSRLTSTPSSGTEIWTPASHRACKILFYEFWKNISQFTDLTPSVLGKVVFLCLEFLCSHSPPRCCQYQWWTPLLHQHCSTVQLLMTVV